MKTPNIICPFDIEEMGERAQDTRNVLMRLEEGTEFPFSSFLPVFSNLWGHREQREGRPVLDIPEALNQMRRKVRVKYPQVAELKQSL